MAPWRWLDLLFLVLVVGALGVHRFGHKSPHYVTTTSQESRFWRGPFPEGRVSITGEHHEVKGEPLYWEFFAPKKYREAKLRVVYRATHERVRIGFQKKDGSFVFQDLPKTRDEFEQKDLVFSLSESFRRDGALLKVVLSAPGINKEQTLEIKELSLDLSL